MKLDVCLTDSVCSSEEWKEPWPVLLTESKRLGWVTKEGLGVAAGILHRLTEQFHRVQVHFNDSGIPWTTITAQRR